MAIAEYSLQILLSTYNGERFLREQLDSYLAMEDNEDMRVLIRDDGSKDGTIDILKEYEKDHGFQVILGENIGITRSLYELFQMRDRTCCYYAISDQDDVWLPNKFSLARSLLKIRDSETPLLFASLSQIVNEQLCPIGITETPGRGIDFYNAMIQNSALGHTQVLNRALMDWVASCYSPDIFVIDWWIYLFATAFGEVVFASEPTVLHRQHGDNAVGYEIKKGANTINRVRRMFSGNPSALSRQLSGFYVFSEDLSAEKKGEVEAFLLSQGRFSRRLAYCCQSRCHRHKGWEDMAFRLLYLFGRYRIR